MSTQRDAILERREFLRGLAITLTAAAPLSTAAIADTETNGEKRKPRYQETDHVKSFYRANRYPR